MHEKHDTTEPAEPTPRDVALRRLALLTALKDRVVEAEKQAYAAASTHLGKGDTSTIVNPANPEEVIVKITKVRGRKRADITHRGDVEKWVVANYPGKTETKTVVNGSQADVIAVLREHAPFLLEEVTEVPAHAVNELCLLSAAAGEPVGFGGEIGEQAPPGIEVVEHGVTVRVLRQPGGQDVVARMWRSGAVSLDELLALPSGGE